MDGLSSGRYGDDDVEGENFATSENRDAGARNELRKCHCSGLNTGRNVAYPGVGVAGWIRVLGTGFEDGLLSRLTGILS